jgi:DNA-binding NtrC family response regulator
MPAAVHVVDCEEPSMASVPTTKVLIVEPDLAYARALAVALHASGLSGVRHTSSVQGGLRELAHAPELIVTELCFPKGDCVELLQAARKLTRAPLIVAMSAHAGRELVARSMLEGADVYIEKPADPIALQERLAELRVDAGAVYRRLARLLVGRVGLKEAQELLRGSMNTEALERTRGSRRAAATLLGVDRRYVQRLARKLAEEGEPVAGTSGSELIGL